MNWPITIVSVLGTFTAIIVAKAKERLNRPVIEIEYEDYQVLISPPKGEIWGKYFVVIKEKPPSKKVIVRASPKIYLGDDHKIKIVWKKDRGEEINKLLQEAMNKFFREIARPESEIGYV